jgi:hypothetical protein
MRGCWKRVGEGKTGEARRLINNPPSLPSMTFPKIVFLPFRCGALAYVMKNCELFAFDPLLAMLRMPRRSATR